VRVLGIDPGSRIAGYGCVDSIGASPRLVEAGVFRLGGSDAPLPRRLAALEEDLAEAIDRLAPALIGVEAVFSHTSWPASAITMAHARGVVLLAAQKAGAELVEIPPATIKKALTGSGRASKDQVRRAVVQTLGTDGPLEPADVSDALAVALTASSRRPAGPETGGPAAIHSRS
jgi:crossover junction endodeoxyribonuclease RuvC